MVQRWPTKKLGEICEERKEKNINNENLPVFTVSHIYGLIPYQSIFYKQIHSKDTKNYKIVNCYDFAFGLPTKDTLPYGLLESEKKVLVSPAYVVFLIKDKNLLFPRFLYYLLKVNSYKWKIIEIAKSQSATRHGLPLKYHHLAELEIPLPPFPIQQKIVKILDTIQEAVEVQEKIIEKSKELKKSLMSLLFHYGLAGLRVKELASSRVCELASSELKKLGLRLKKTEVGEIPENWEVVRLGEVALEFLGGGTPSTNVIEYWDGEIPWTTSSIIDEDKVCILNKGQKYISKLGLDNSSAQLVPAFNLLVGTRVGVGKVAINEIDIAINQDLTGIIYNRKKINLLYFAYILKSPLCQEFFSNYKRGATIKGIPRNDLKAIPIPLPPLSEQQEIAEILQTIDQKIEIEQRKKELYHELFKTMLNKIMNQQINIDLLDY